jgi:RNA polymerase sigma-70 factor (ECF subfamily)
MHSGDNRLMSHLSRDGRVARFESFYEKHYLEISGYVRRRVPDHEASDVIGQVFFVAWRRFDRVPSGPEDRLWLFGVARRSVANNRRSALRRLRLQIRLAQQPPREALLVEDAESDFSQLRRTIDSLRPADREVLLLVLWEDLSHAEAATVLNCSVNAFEIRYRRARKRVRDAVADPQTSVEAIEPEPTTTQDPRRICHHEY